MRTTHLFVLPILFVCSTLSASPLRPESGEAVHVRLGTHRERAVALKAGQEGWYLALAAPPDGEVEAIDVTPRHLPRRLRVLAIGRLLLFERHRFEADHAYRLESPSGRLTVYLRPSTRPRLERLHISEEEAVADLALVPAHETTP